MVFIMIRYLISTKKKEKLHKVILEACNKHINKNQNNIITHTLTTNRNISIYFIWFFFKKLISMSLFDVNKIINLKYKNFNIGVYAASHTFTNHKVFFNKFSMYLDLFKNLLIVAKKIDYSLSLVKISKGIYVDHVGYISGVNIQVFAKNKKIVYCNGYPRGLCFVDYSKKKNFQLSPFDILKIKKKSSKKKIKHKDIKNKYRKILKNPKANLKWMKYTSYDKLSKKKILAIDLKKFDYLIYAHSFVDGQLFYGYDGFANLLDWLEFSIINLKKLNKRILIKPHPNFYNKLFGKVAEQDREIFLKLKRKYEDESTVFIDIPIENNEILKRVNRNIVLISHHGTAILEGTFLGFKTICSQSNIWSKEFKISNQWNDIKSYKKILIKKPEKLKNFKNSSDFFEISSQLFFNDYGHGGSKNFISIIEKFTKKIDWKKAQSKPYLIYDQIKNRDDYIKIVNKVSQNIEEIIC